MENVLHLWDSDKDFKSKAYKSTCALLNSNGGKLILNTKMTADKIIRPIEQNCQSFLATLGVNQKLKVSSEHRKPNQIILEVKGHGKLCTMNYNLYLPTDTQAMLVSPLEVCAVKKILDIEKTTDDITENDKEIPTEFILNCSIKITESKTVQFKCLRSEKSGRTDLASRLEKNKLTHYVSAFANHCGGRLYCGVEDDGTVQGQKVKDEEKEDLTSKISKYINKMIWPEYCGEPQRGKDRQWDISFEPVKDEEGNPIPSTFVIVIFIAPCPGGVFASEPESYHIVDGKVQRMRFSTSKRKFLYPGQDLLETNIVSRVSQCEWSSDSVRLTCDRLDGALLKLINNGNWDRFKALVTNLQRDIPENDEQRLVLLTKRIMFHYRKDQYDEAENCLPEFDNRLSTANDVLLFEVRRLLILSAMERSRGNHQKSYEIARDCLLKVQMIAPSILTVEFYVHFGTMLTIMESNKDLRDFPKEDLSTGSFKEEAIEFFNKALQHLQEADYVPNSKADMEQKTLINLAYLYLGCSLSGDVVDEFVTQDNIEKAKGYIDRAKSLIPITFFRKCHLSFADASYLYRQSQLQPVIEERIELLEDAIQEVKDAEARAYQQTFDELVRYARKHAEVYREELNRLEQL